MLNKIKSFFKKKEPNSISEYSHYVKSAIDKIEQKYSYLAASFLNVTENKEDEIDTQKESERREKLWKEAEETLFQMKKVKRASEKVYEKMLITEKMYKDSLNGNK